MIILFASHNLHKKKEVARILYSHTILDLQDLGFDYLVEETGSNFVENALLKAQTLHKKRKHRSFPLNIQEAPICSDDSGIYVDTLEGPGLYSARYGNEEGIYSQADQNQFLLKNLGSSHNRSARYICAAVRLSSENHFLISQETWEGSIADTQREGVTGFGYDPLFIPKGYTQTVSEISEDIKHSISHRAKAFAVLF